MKDHKWQEDNTTLLQKKADVGWQCGMYQQESSLQMM